MEDISMKKREEIRKINTGNSFYDVFKSRTYKDKEIYKMVAGITPVIFSKAVKKK